MREEFQTLWRHYAVRIRFMSPTRICYRLLCTFFNLYISMFNTGQWALCPLPFSVQPLLCFLLTALAEQPTAEAACFFVKQRDSSPLCLCLLMCCPLYFIWTGSWNFFSTPSLQLDLLIKRLRKNTRTLPDILACVGLSSWGSHKALGSFTWSPLDVFTAAAKKFVKSEWIEHPNESEIVWETWSRCQETQPKESNWK